MNNKRINNLKEILRNNNIDGALYGVSGNMFYLLDDVDFTFTTDIDSVYNFTIEKEAEMINYETGYASITGNSTKLYMVYVKKICFSDIIDGI